MVVLENPEDIPTWELYDLRCYINTLFLFHAQLAPLIYSGSYSEASLE